MGEGFIIIYQQIDKDVKVEWKGINRQKKSANKFTDFRNRMSVNFN